MQGKQPRDRQKILIVDDSEMNRSILADILEEEYEILEAEDGVQGVTILQSHETEISLVLLDIVMPRMDGFGVLEVMNKRQWIESVPVIMISAENHSSFVDKAYESGVTDFISRPFDAQVVHRRVDNTILLYAKQKRLEMIVAEQMYEKEHRSSLMVDILSHIVEFRNGESGLHVLHVRTLTELLCRRLMQKTEKYGLTQADISVISTASALHDIGKISIDETILNKPGRLTDEEFAIMKTHSMVGARMLGNLPVHQEMPLVQIAYEICRWHHERYDGRGYPDGLKGDEIPISAQIVSMADVYDALTSERIYKKAFSHEKAVRMILDGECGTFNPLLLECLMDLADTLAVELQNSALEGSDQHEMEIVAREMAQYKDMNASSRTLQLLEQERMKFSFYANMAQEIQFEFTLSPPMVSLNSWGASELGLDEIIVDPMQDKRVVAQLGKGDWDNVRERLRDATKEEPKVIYEGKFSYNGALRWFRVIAQVLWSSDEASKPISVIGKMVDIHNARTNLEFLERQASTDALTNLLNHASAKKQITERLKNHSSKFALAILDLDHFKSANDNYGHHFGDEILTHVAKRLHQNVRSADIAARIGGDEFMIFLEYKEGLEAIMERIFSSLNGEMYRSFPILLSMGVARADMGGNDYDTLFQAADQALYAAKNSGRGKLCFYDSTLAALSHPDEKMKPIDR